jgi:hypothetical protein
MSEIENQKKAADKGEDWAIIPFDETEDDALWAHLSQEMDELIEKTESTEKLTGTILMEEDLSRFVSEKSQTEKGESAEDELF